VSIAFTAPAAPLFVGEPREALRREADWGGIGGSPMIEGLGFATSTRGQMLTLEPVSYREVPLQRVIENTHFTAFLYQFGLSNDPF
jgi:hypothetical protein